MASVAASSSVARAKVEICQYRSVHVRLPSLSLLALWSANSLPSHFPRAMPAVILKSHSLFSEHQIPNPIEAETEMPDTRNNRFAQQSG